MAHPIVSVAESLVAGSHIAAVASPLQSLELPSCNFGLQELLEGSGLMTEEVAVQEALRWVVEACGGALDPFNALFSMGVVLCS